MKIGIVGGGATGITVLNHLSEALLTGTQASEVSDIYIFDKAGFDGGLAYRTPSEHHLLNMRISTMSAVPGDPDHFLKWLQSAGINCSGNDHLPRRFYKRYLDHVKEAAIALCHALGVAVHDICDEVVQLRPISDDHVRLETSDGSTYTAAAVVLCTGHNEPEDPYRLAGTGGYRRDPYSPGKLADRSGIEIGILGTGLTAVDSIIALVDELELPNITGISRSGRFPKVQPKLAVAIDPGFAERVDAFVRAHVRLTADALVAEIETALESTAGIAIDLGQSDDGGADGIDDLAASIAAAKSGEATAYSYLSRLSDIICDAWNRLDNVEKRRFLDVYYSGWMRHRHAMPLVNAEKILGIARAERLATAGRLRGIVRVGERFRADFGDGTHRAFDYIVAANGPSYALRNCPLHADLVRQGLVAVNEFGGISCDFRDGKVLDRQGRRSRTLYAVGSITRGTHFYAAAVDINLSRAQAVVGSMLREVERAHPAPVAPEGRIALAAGD